jgi:hypothetical protein
MDLQHKKEEMSYLSCFLALNILMILDEGLEDLLPVDAPLELLRVHLGNLLEKGLGCRTYSYCGFKGLSFVPQNTPEKAVRIHLLYFYNLRVPRKTV